MKTKKCDTTRLVITTYELRDPDVRLIEKFCTAFGLKYSIKPIVPTCASEAGRFLETLTVSHK